MFTAILSSQLQGSVFGWDEEHAGTSSRNIWNNVCTCICREESRWQPQWCLSWNAFGPDLCHQGCRDNSQGHGSSGDTLFRWTTLCADSAVKDNLTIDWVCLSHWVTVWVIKWKQVSENCIKCKTAIKSTEVTSILHDTHYKAYLLTRKLCAAPGRWQYDKWQQGTWKGLLWQPSFTRMQILLVQQCP